MALYQIFNGAMPTTAAIPAVALGAATIKTLMQIKPSATIIARVREWGISFDGSAAGAGVKCELIETDVAATSLTAYVANDITKLDSDALNGGDPTTNLIQVGTSASGYTAGGEGTITSVRVFDTQLVQPTNQYIKQFPLGTEPVLQINKFARIRATAPAGVNAICYMTIEI